MGIGQEVGDGDVGGVDYGELLVLFLGRKTNLFNFRARKGEGEGRIGMEDKGRRDTAEG